MKSFSLALSLTILLGLCGVTFASTWYVDSSVSSGTGTIDDPFPNFYDAVVSAASGDIIYARGGTYSGTMNTGFKLTVDGISELTFETYSDGEGNLEVIIDLQSDFPNPFITAVAPLSSSSTETALTMSGFTFINNPYGMALDLHSSSLVELTDCHFRNNGHSSTSSLTTHALRLNSTSILMTSCTFENNYSPLYGGAIYFHETSGVIEGCSFVGNSVEKNDDIDENTIEGSGGAILILGSSINSIPSISHTNFTSNTASSGGAIRVSNATVTPFDNYDSDVVAFILKNCTFSNNSAVNGWGGGVMSLGFINILECLFVGNSGQWGGAVGLVGEGYGNYWVGLVDGSEFHENVAFLSGGAFYYTAPFSDLHLYHSSFTNNTVIGQHGGAFYGDTAGNSIIVKETVFEGNSAQLPETGNGGAIALFGHNFYFSLEPGTKFLDNTAGNHGGAIYSLFAIKLTQTIFQWNAAEGLGGGIYMEIRNPALIKKCDFSNNSAQRGGGIYLIGDKNTTHSAFSNTNFAGNTAIHSGGALSLYFQKDSGEREEKRQEKEGDTAINSLHVINNIFINNEVKGSGGVGGGVDFGGEAGNEVYALVSGNYFEGNGARGGGNDIHATKDGIDFHEEQLTFFNNTFSNEDPSASSYDLYFESYVVLFEKKCALPRVGMKENALLSLCDCSSPASFVELGVGGAWVKVDGDVEIQRLQFDKANITYIPSTSCKNSTKLYTSDYFLEGGKEGGEGGEATVTVEKEGMFEAGGAYVGGLDVEVGGEGLFTIEEEGEIYMDGGNFVNEGTLNINAKAYLGDQNYPFIMQNNNILNFQNETTIHGNLSLGYNSKMTITYPQGLKTRPEELVHIIGIASLSGSNVIDFGNMKLDETGEGLVMFWSNFTGSFRSFSLDTHTSKTSAKELCQTGGLYVLVEKNEGGSVNAGAVVGIVIGGLVLVAAVVVGAWFYYKKKQSPGGYDTIF